MRVLDRWASFRLLGAGLLGAGLLGACASEAEPPERALPQLRVGAELAGRDGIAALPTRFAGARPELLGKVAIVRWWTDGCPFCELSMPALDELVARHAARGLVGLGVYHPKPPRAVLDDEVIEKARELAWRGSVAIDADWSALRTLWLDGAKREATSATFVLDRAGKIRWLHPGPELHPSQEAEHKDCARDFAELEAAVELLLDESH